MSSQNDGVGRKKKPGHVVRKRAVIEKPVTALKVKDERAGHKRLPDELILRRTPL